MSTKLQQGRRVVGVGCLVAGHWLGWLMMSSSAWQSGWGQTWLEERRGSRKIGREVIVEN